MKIIKNWIIGFLLCLFISLHSCMNYGPTDEQDLSSLSDGNGLLIANEGNFMYGNASLSYYKPVERTVENEVFSRANGRKLGDVAQSVSVYDGEGYIVVNNSGVIYVIDLTTFKLLDEITGFISPRYIHFVEKNKAYVTDLYAGQITIINPATHRITGHIKTQGHPSTEQMVQYGKYVFVNCWSSDNKILVIDTQKDLVVDSLQVGIQPNCITIDRNNKIWVTTDGGYEGSPYGREAPSLYKIDAYSRQIERIFKFRKGEQLSRLCMNGTRDTLYYINKGIWKIGVNDVRLPIRPLLPYQGTLYYGLAIDPRTSEIYVADAIDYVQPGIVYRYSPQAVPIDTFRVGITPGAFCFK